jgi:hypothetical protein
MARTQTETGNETHAVEVAQRANMIEVRHRRSAWRRMRDSNSRGVAPNTVSNNVGQRSPAFTTVRDVG